MEVTYIVLACGYIGYGFVAIAGEVCQIEAHRRLWDRVHHLVVIGVGLACAYAAWKYGLHLGR
ncbi:MAG: hypothetical protein WDN06_05160 [Asticcacaulis sp.]